MSGNVPVIRPYQAEGIDFLVDHGRAALFDEPGLGKSMQALLSMRDLEPRESILIVSPGDALGVWQDEVRFWLDEEPGVFAGLKPSRDEIKTHGFTITNYARLPVVLPSRSWGGVIFDESQMLRNRNTRTLFKTVREYFDKARYGLGRIPLFALSGTPIVKSTGDIWPILHLIDKHRWRGYWSFVQKYAITWQDEHGWHVEGTTNVKAMWEEISSVALRRKADEVQPDLPPKIRKPIPLNMTPRQARAYNELERDMIAEIGEGQGLILTPTVLSRETRLRQLLSSPRLLGIDDSGAVVLALREIARSHDRPIVVFTPWREALTIYKEELSSVRPNVHFVRGGMGLGLSESVKAFIADAKAGNAPVLISTLPMAKGWDVSEVTHECYMAEFDWNDTTMEQAERRLARNKQKHTVFSNYFVHRDSHDEDALAVLSGKRRLASVILDRVRKRGVRAGK